MSVTLHCLVWRDGSVDSRLGLGPGVPGAIPNQGKKTLSFATAIELVSLRAEADSLLMIQPANSRIDSAGQFLYHSRQLWCQVYCAPCLLCHAVITNSLSPGVPTLKCHSVLPCCSQKNYRHHVVNTIWTLNALDHHVISDEEIIEDAIFKNSRFITQHRNFEIDLTPPHPKVRPPPGHFER